MAGFEVSINGRIWVFTEATDIDGQDAKTSHAEQIVRFQ
jgi:hypothetical protein